MQVGYWYLKEASNKNKPAKISLFRHNYFVLTSMLLFGFYEEPSKWTKHCQDRKRLLQKTPSPIPLLYKSTEEGTHVPESELLRGESSNYINLVYGF